MYIVFDLYGIIGTFKTYNKAVKYINYMTKISGYKLDLSIRKGA